MSIKIGLAAPMRSGKDTVADYLVEHYGFKKFAFGDGIRSICRELFPDQMRQAKPRALLQGVGQAMRQYDNEVWINRALYEIETKQAENIVISDVRQPDEYYRLKSEGFIIVRVNAKSAVRVKRMAEAGDNFSVEDLTHETESHVDRFEVAYELYNDSSLRDLYEQIDVMMRDIAGKNKQSRDEIERKLNALKETESHLAGLAAMFEKSLYLESELARVRKEIRTLSQ